jgi:hypothetical protein
MTTDAMAVPADAEYPMEFQVEYPENLSRLLIFVKWILVIPQLLIVTVLGYVNAAIAFIALFAVLFTKKYPRGLFDFYVGAQRWTVNTTVYGFLLMRDEYPPFSMDSGNYPVAYDVPYPEELGRFSPLYQWLLAFPHMIVLTVLIIAELFAIFFAWFAILFTGKYPRGLWDFVEGTTRWTYRVTNYIYFLRNEYPPFSLK